MSKDTAQQEVEKVCFAYEKAGETGNIKDWGKFYDLEDSLINKVEVANQTKLSIPKKIAEELLEFRKSLSDPDTELLGWGSIVNALYQYPEFSENFRAWWDERKGEANNLTIAYLNPLTRPFVEVEG
ncbi:hypothetical protein [Lactococcus garvieae]|uniref:hypothetical protein n=1 Tax=Lactococcus garvieae TaxID=1363 RepID=UPI00288ED687|nr:hypothetical protein [Lactococcus garvieae]MDT2741978.1 hypothetical protein [Lactococcus garvieae]